MNDMYITTPQENRSAKSLETTVLVTAIAPIPAKKFLTVIILFHPLSSYKIQADAPLPADHTAAHFWMHFCLQANPGNSNNP